MRLPLLLLMLSSYLLVVECATAPPNSIAMKVFNAAGAPVEIFWINTFEPSRDLVAQTTKPLRNSTEASINSYNTHQFVAKFHKTHPEAAAYFTKGPREEKVIITFDEETQELRAKQVTKFDEIMELIEAGTASCDEKSGDDFAACISEIINAEVDRLKETKMDIKKYRDLMAARLREYICNDLVMNATEPIETKKFKLNKRKYNLNMLLNTDSAKIWTVKNLVSTRECNHLAQHSQALPTSFYSPTIVSATMDYDGVSKMASTNGSSTAELRTSYMLDLENPEQDPLWPLYSTVYHITNHVTKYNGHPSGQEGFLSSVYSVGDDYQPMCDGACDESMFHPGGRVSSVHMHCQVANDGGAVVFPKSDVLIRPERGEAIFVAYKGDLGHMDDGYTEHSACPVLHGSKRVTSLHMRLGVSEQQPFHKFDNVGNLL